MRADIDPEASGTSLAMVVKIGLLIFLVLLIVFTAAAYFFGDGLLLMEYEGYFYGSSGLLGEESSVYREVCIKTATESAAGSDDRHSDGILFDV